jgi:hypothetical protein
MRSIDGDILYQVIDPLTRSISPQFINQFANVGQQTLDLFIELKIVMTSNITRKEENIINFFRKLDSVLPSLPTFIQDWFKKFYRIRIPNEIKGKILSRGQLQSIDKTYAFDSIMGVINPLQWFNRNTIPPYYVLEEKIPGNIGEVPRNLNSGSFALFATRRKKLAFCKNRALNASIPKVAMPDKPHGQPLVGDYEFPKRMGKIATEYYAKIMQFLGVNKKYVMDNYNYNPATSNVQTGAPILRVPSKIGDKTIIGTVYGPPLKKAEVKSPFKPRKLV